MMLPAVLALCGILAFNIGIGAVWPLIGQLGISRGVASSVCDATIALAGFAAIAGGIVAAVLGARVGRLPILTLCMVCLAIAMLMLKGSFSATEYRVLVLVFMFFWPLSIPFLLGTLAALDPSGRLAALSGAMLPCGMSLGQGLAATRISNGDFAQVIWIGMPAVLVALGFLAAGTWASRPNR
jgi:predicted MFS family arabinose efflux permease